MEEENQEQRYEEEEEMAGGPVSAGASNSGREPQSGQADEKPAEQQQPDYNKMMRTESSGPEYGRGMATDQRSGSPGGGTLPTESETGTSRGGMNTSNSTVGAGGSSGGTVIGSGEPRDRGSAATTGLDQTTNTVDQIAEENRDQPNQQNS